MSLPSRASSNRRGALPGRNPGIRTSRASLRNAASIARSNSGAGTTTWSLTRFATPAGLSSGASVSPSLSTGSTVLCIRRKECTGDVRPARAYDLRVTVDRGITHVALPVTDLAASLEFYERYARMHVVHQRSDGASGTSVAWISDLTRPFVLVLIEVPDLVGTTASHERLGGIYCHVGLGVASRDDVDELCRRARAESRTVLGPVDSGPPVGYWAYLVDPDGHNLEISFGQEVGLTVEQAQ